MSELPTVRVRHPRSKSGFAIINVSDLTPDHVLFDAPAEPEQPAVEPSAPSAVTAEAEKVINISVNSGARRKAKGIR
jgi:hypothetical protein